MRRSEKSDGGPEVTARQKLGQPMEGNKSALSVRASPLSLCRVPPESNSSLVEALESESNPGAQAVAPSALSAPGTLGPLILPLPPPVNKQALWSQTYQLSSS